MASDSTLSSRVSLISLDPAVASHITATTVPSTSQYGSSPRKSTKTPDTEITHRHVRNNSAPNTLDKKRSNSLRRVKNSTEILRQRSTKSARKQRQQDPVLDTRGGRNFTVGNVGTGGILYLTPSAFQAPGLHSINPISPPTVTTPVTAPALLSHEHLQTSLQAVSDSSSQARSTSPKRSIRASNRRVARPNHARSQSFSTVEEHRHSLSAPVQSRTLRIVINRPDTARPETAKESIEELNEELSPTLEVPIPHYRIGTFRFSNHGTPVLRNSSFTRASATGSDMTPTAATARLDQYFQGPPASSLKVFARPPPAHLGVEDDPATLNPPGLSSDSTTSVQPAAFDQLTQIYDDPSVVRYCQNVREITAATPARIIAQISSDSFMDYELVSDFFLTFRSYMSTYTVLDLLLARLRWAIARLEDDGRIIRVRTFAALRHWILNYFMDDFFIDLRLRERFCAEVNKLHRDVKASPENGYSDLKLLRDLKRCWNGRCSLCWDSEGFELDGDQEEDLLPGGPMDIQQSTPRPRTAVRPFHPPAEIPRPDILRGPSHSWFEVDKTATGFHDRQLSTDSDQIPPSLGSDGSLQANSCFPPKAFLRPSPEANVNAKGPHPVSVQHRRKNAPANLQVNTHSGIGTKPSHKRGASSIDSNRESTPRKTEAEPEAIMGEEGNIIRGLLYSPSAPFVQIIATNSTQSLDRTEVGGMREGPRRAHGTQSATQPTGRNIFGSLRKVLGNKQGQVDVTLVTASHSAQDVPIRTQKPAMPLNLSKSHDELRNQAGLALARKGEVRIDLLCAAVCQNYESKFPSKHRITYGAFFTHNPPMAPADNTDGGLNTPRLNNRATAQSGSILIVDDTRPELPSMSGALRPNTDDMIGVTPASETEALFNEGVVILPKARSDSMDAVATQRSSDVLGTVMDVPSADGSNDTLDKLATGASFGGDHFALTSGLSGERLKTPTTVSSRTEREGNTSLDLARPNEQDASSEKASLVDESHDAGGKGDEDSNSHAKDEAPTHTLRRRPGGDLRRVENVQDLDHSTHHNSLDTVSAASDSAHESLLIMRTDTGRTIKRDPDPPRKAISMINTHSSQHLRPSFEAAVAEFSAIPDDDDGGLEATLMKLEGRYEKKSPPMEQHPLDTTGKRRSLPDLKTSSHIDLRDPVRQARQSLDIQIREITNDLTSRTSLDGLQQASNPTSLGLKQSSSRKSSIFGLPTESIAGSEESDGSLPLLKRDAAHESTTGPANTIQGPVVAPGYFAQDPPQLFHLPKAPPPSGNKHAHMQSISRPDTANDSARSFLLDEDENLSDLSSEISVDIINYSDVVDNSMAPMLAAPGTAISGLEIPAHPLTYASVVNLNALEQSARTSDSIPHEIDPARLQAKIPNSVPPRSREKPMSQPLSRVPAGPAHVPFVLACDSQVLAQQLTLVEKSALSEVEWSDLVEMRWDSKAAEVLDWVDCLTQTKVRGIDLVIARFNLVVKWAMSEIILTQDIHERARVITKYIHVAAHARRLHNYATMLQLTIALTSTDCTRLTKTWALVSAPDMSLLKHMESLVQPIRNFHDLRLEMESADLSDGCIPFIGLYVHDLTYNAQKPSRIPSGPGRESLINFERYRTCAIIVKGLLRLIDAGSRYSFEPIEGVIERCLWLAALPDDRIRSTSKSLEW
ncbi:uncharacterized protein A1O9_01878 [Exophiala aquamarina CBS 119918]|uniref:Guanine nucleotide exchange factor LTE1 n=1 Tax=Exophiala aquamarina CBS 119918 TaxID=1182545 RepID=A0A072PLX7_9EURO|nr:uncharacterized protein A1O9_01878 [Exophiala aquamarina CBS 119918]KEF60318.1 hypothetical protein A1O9_01878 [Exophiala aquamarina CBS 119918]